MKKIIIISVSIIIAISGIAYFAVDYFGQKAFDALVDSASTLNIDTEAITKIAELPIPSEPPTENADVPKTEEAQKNNTVEKTGDVVKETPKPAKKEVTIEDKAQAINLVKSKFSAGEIADIQGKVARGLTSQEMSEIKSMVKSRLSAQEIAKIKEWYAKYK